MQQDERGGKRGQDRKDARKGTRTRIERDKRWEER